MNAKETELSTYKIQIAGHLKEAWAEWLNEMVVRIQNLDDGSNTTTITVQIPDQAALRGVLNKLWDLNLTLLAVVLQGGYQTGDRNEN